MKTLIFLLFLICVHYAASGQGNSINPPAASTEDPPLISVGVVAPDWKLPVLTRRTNVALDIERGRIVLVDFWTKNSNSCVAMIPRLNALQAKYTQKNVEVLGINCNDSKEEVIRFYTRYKPRYHIAMEGAGIAERYGVTGYPTVVLLDKNGRVLYAGNWDEGKVSELIDKSLQ